MPIDFDLTEYLNPIYIETGTLYGASAKKAVEAGFEMVYTVEIHPKYFRKSRRNLMTEIKENKVVLLNGDSKIVLPIVLAGISRKCTR